MAAVLPVASPDGRPETGHAPSRVQQPYAQLREEAQLAAGAQAFLERDEEERLERLLRAKGGGSALRGWRRELDPQGSLEVSYTRFCDVCLRLGHVSNVQELTSRERDFANIALTQALPGVGALLAAFRKFIRQRFGSCSGFFDALDPSSLGHASKESFLAVCRLHGFDASAEELEEIFGCCDVADRASIPRASTIFLELDSKKRANEVQKLKRQKAAQHETMMLRMYNEGNVNSLPPRHRLGIRPWQAKHFEELPAVERERQAQQARLRHQRGLQARMAFVRHLRHLHGNEVVAWRRGLDPEERFVVSEAALRRYCRTIDFAGSVDALWESLDPDSDGSLTLEKLSIHAADLLASFRAWAQQALGSCLALLERAATSGKAAPWSPRSRSATARSAQEPDGFAPVPPAITFGTFTEVLRTCGCPMVAGEEGRFHLWFLCRALDSHGSGLLFQKDLQWLDAWQPAEWLAKEQDEAAWLSLRKLLLDKHDHFLRAWRFDLDTDNSDCLSWPEFLAACTRTNFRGNVGGAWRWLDKDMFGFVNLRQVDEESAQLLYSFKEWAEINFGSLQRAVKAITLDGSDSFTYQELRSAVARHKWPGGDRRLFFACFSVDGQRVLYKDIAFLSKWTGQHQENAADFKRTTDVLWSELRGASPAGRGTSAKRQTRLLTGRLREDSALQHKGAATAPGFFRGGSATPAGERRLGASPHSLSLPALVGAGEPAAAPQEPLVRFPHSHCSPRASSLGEPYALAMRPRTCARKAGRRAWDLAVLEQVQDLMSTSELPVA